MAKSLVYLGATLSNGLGHKGLCDQEAKQGGCRLQILWVGEQLKSVGLCDLVGASDQLSSMENGLCGKWMRGGPGDGLTGLAVPQGRGDDDMSQGRLGSVGRSWKYIAVQ